MCCILIHCSFKIIDQHSEQVDNVVSHKVIPVNEIGSTHLNSNYSVSEHSKGTEVIQQNKIKNVVQDTNIDNNKCDNSK